jgi:hypothetical protein
MLNQFNDYFAALAITDPMKERLQKVADLLNDIGIKSVDDIFLDQSPAAGYLPPGAPPQYGGQSIGVGAVATTFTSPTPEPPPISGAWFFSGDLVMESPDIMSGSITLDQVSIEHSVLRWEVRRQAFRPGAAASDSWLSRTLLSSVGRSLRSSKALFKSSVSLSGVGHFSATTSYHQSRICRISLRFLGLSPNRSWQF